MSSTFYVREGNLKFSHIFNRTASSFAWSYQVVSNPPNKLTDRGGWLLSTRISRDQMLQFHTILIWTLAARNDKQTKTNLKPSEKVCLFLKGLWRDPLLSTITITPDAHEAILKGCSGKTRYRTLKRYSNQGKIHNKMAQFQTHEGVRFHKQN
jgi:hypothetical protein